MKSTIMLLAALLASGAGAKTVYVNCNFDDYTGHDGSTPELALKTLLEATGYKSSNPYAADDGDTVMVAEGVYNEGESDPTGWWGQSRIFIEGKKLYIKASGRREYTIIEGRRSSDSALGLGEGAVRCLTCQGTVAAESIIEGFTFRNGFTKDSSVITGGGGAVCCSDSGNTPLSGRPYIVDCMIENCCGRRATVAMGGAFIRSIIRDCEGYSNGYFCWQSTFVNCLITHISCYSTDGLRAAATQHFDQAKIINTTLADNFCNFWLNSPSIFYNNLVSGNAISVGGAEGAYSGIYNNSKTARVLIAPGLGDGRLREGCVDTVKVADAQWLGSATVDLPSGEAPWSISAYQDLYGNEIPTEGTICAGCSQGVGAGVATPVSGPIILSDNNLNLGFDPDRPSHYGTYIYPLTYPSSTRVYATEFAKKGKGFIRFNYYIGTTTKWPYTPVNDAIDVVPSPTVDEITDIAINTSTETVLWCDPNAEAEGADGSEAKPYPTIQAAIESLEKPQNCVIYCKAGTYGDNQGFVNCEWNGSTGNFRFAIPESYTIRIKAVEGPEKTFLEGKRDPETADGCGLNAVAIICGKGLGLIQGFTIQNSYASHDKSSCGYYNLGRGGVLYTYGKDFYITDCVIRNNVGGYSAVGCGRYYRCKIYNNVGGTHIIGDSASLYSCVVYGNTVSGNYSQVYSDNGDIFGCSISGDATSHAIADTAAHKTINTVVDNGGTMAWASGGNWGSVFYGYASYQEGGANYLKANPCLADLSTGDLRMGNASAGIGYGISTEDENANFWKWESFTDVNLKPRTFLANGKVRPGAYDDGVNGVYIAAPQGGLQVTNGKIGMNPEGELSVAVAATDGTRPCVGVRVNGELQTFEAAPGYQISFTPAQNAIVEAEYSNEWFCAPDGDDTASGSYPAAAKTLQGALAKAAANDTVKALDGTYKTGSMIQAPGAGQTVALRSRAVVPADVTLESVNGRDVTIIEGEIGTTDDDPVDEAGKGMGVEAMRGVTLMARAKIKGFTVRNGHTRGVVGDTKTDLHSGSETTGGGIGSYLGNRSTAWAEDCLVENCSAYRGGGAMAILAKNCIFRNNYSVYIGGAMSDGKAFGCLTYDNINHYGGADAKGFAYMSEIEGCTVLDGCALDGTSRQIRNTLVVGSYTAGKPLAENVKNCVFNRSLLGGAADDWIAEIPTAKVAANADGLQLDDNYRPIIGANLAVDAGDAAVATQLGETDLFGGQRIYNAVLDAGALEGDWRGAYAQDLNKKGRVAVLTASSDVQEVGEGVKSVQLSNESTLEVQIAATTKPFSVPVKVADGTLTVMVGETVTEYTADTTIELGADEISSATFAYAGTGAAEIGTFKSQSGVAFFIR